VSSSVADFCQCSLGGPGRGLPRERVALRAPLVALRFYEKKCALSPSLSGLFWVVPGGGRGVCVWGCKECESTKSHVVEVVRLCACEVNFPPYNFVR
jgi:hypothetical protein